MVYVISDTFPIAELVFGPVIEPEYKRYVGVKLAGVSDEDRDEYRVPRLLSMLAWVRTVEYAGNCVVDGLDLEDLDYAITVNAVYDEEHMPVEEINRAIGNLGSGGNRGKYVLAVTLGLFPGQVLVFCRDRVNDFDIEAVLMDGVEYAMISKVEVYGGRVIELLVPELAHLSRGHRGQETSWSTFLTLERDIRLALSLDCSKKAVDD